MVGIEIVVNMGADDRALIDRQCRVMEALIEHLRDYLAVKRKADDREITETVNRWEKTVGNYSESV